MDKSVTEYNHLLELLQKQRYQTIIENSELNKEIFKNLYAETTNKFNEAKLHLSKCREIEAKIRMIKPNYQPSIKKYFFETG